MIGTSINEFIDAYQREASKTLARTKGDMASVIYEALDKLRALDVLDRDDLKTLQAGFSEALDVLAAKGKPSAVRSSSRERHISTIVNAKSPEVVRVLAELCYGVISDSVARFSDEERSATARAQIQGKGEQALLWGAIGALVGFGAGGVLGAAIGAGVGAAIGSCGDNPTTVTVTNNGGTPS